MPGAKRTLDTRHQHQPALPGVLGVGRRVEVAIVEGDREPSVAERNGPIDQVAGRMVDEICRVFVGVGVQLNLEHTGV